MKQIRLSNENEKAINKLVKDSKLQLLTVQWTANMAIEKGIPEVCKLLVKPSAHLGIVVKSHKPRLSANADLNHGEDTKQ
jgi:hypothetical protein